MLTTEYPKAGNYHMNKIKIYLDTSVISYLDQKDAPEKMKETQDIWRLFKKGQYEIYF